MTHSSEIGFVASALVLIAFGMKNMIHLRIVAICSNFAFIAYALGSRLIKATIREQQRDKRRRGSFAPACRIGSRPAESPSVC